NFELTEKEQLAKETMERITVSEASVHWISMDEITELQKPVMESIPDKCVEENGVIKRIRGDTKKIFIPDEKAESILKDLHVRMGHIGRAQMTYHFTALYYTPQLEKKLNKIVASCEVC